MATETYRGNKIEAKKKDGKPLLLINGKKVPVEPAPDLPGGYRSGYSYLPAQSVETLGRLVVDQQLSLTEPRLAGLKDT
jgi:hypothetical protein